MTGLVTANREPILHLTVRGPTGSTQEVEALIDTGFNGFLTLPATQVASLSLPYHSRTVVTLAEGSRLPLDIYKAAVDWHGRPQTVFVLEAEGGPLVGMSLLYGSRMTLDVIDGGAVNIVRIDA